VKRELSRDHDAVVVLPRIRAGARRRTLKPKRITPAGAEWREYPRIAPGIYHALLGSRLMRGHVVLCR